MICLYIAGGHRSRLASVAQVLVLNGMKLLNVADVSLQQNVNNTRDGGSSVDGKNEKGNCSIRTNGVVQESESSDFVGSVGTQDLDAMVDLLKTEPNMRFVLVTSSIVDTIAEAVDDHTTNFDCSKIVQVWHITHQKLLHFFYRNRDRCVLVDVRDCLANPQNFVEQCKATFELPSITQSDKVSVSTNINSPVGMYLAKRLLSRYPEAISLEHELGMSVVRCDGVHINSFIVSDMDSENSLLVSYRAFEQEKGNSSNIKNLTAELEDSHEKLRQAKVALNECERHNEELIADLHNAYLLGESSIEQKSDFERRAKTLETIANESQRLAENRQTQLDESLVKNLDLQEKQSRIEADNKILVEQFQQVLTDLDRYTEKNRALEDALLTEQERIEHQEERLLEVTDQYESLSSAHLQWVAERETLIDQIELKNQTLVQQDEELQSIGEVHEYQLTVMAEDFHKIQEEFGIERLAKQNLETQWLELALQLDEVSVEHRQWLEERQVLIRQIEVKQNALIVLEMDSQRIIETHDSQLSVFTESLGKVQEQLVREIQAKEIAELQLLHKSTHLDDLTVEHRNWVAERKTLIEQLDSRQNVLAQFELDSRHKFEAYQDELVELTRGLRKVQEDLAIEGAAKEELYARSQDAVAQFDALVIEHQQLLDECKRLKFQIDTKQSALFELNLANEALLSELEKTQKFAEEYFIQNEHIATLLENLETEKRSVESRLLRLQQKYPLSVEFDRLEAVGSPTGDQLKTQWHLVGLETSNRHVPSIFFSTIIEDTALGFSFSKHQATNNGLVRWPGVLTTAAELVLSPVGDATTGPIRAETWLSLASSDLEVLIALAQTLEQELMAGRIATQFGQYISNKMLEGLEAFKQFSNETRGTFRYDQVRLKRETVNDDYEHLWLEFDGVRYNDIRSNHFECRVACSELVSKRFGSFPKLEFPDLEAQQPLRTWYAESHDDFGDKLELRFAPPDLFDRNVWTTLSLDDQGFIVSLLERLPTILRGLELEGAGLQRSWPQWQSVVEFMSACLAGAIITGSGRDSSPTQPTQSRKKDSLSVSSKENALLLGEKNTPPDTSGRAPQTFKERPKASAFLSFLQGS